MEQFPSDVLESLKKTIQDRVSKYEFKFNDYLSCDVDFYETIKNYLISMGLFNPQTDELTISSPAKEQYHFDVKIVRPIYKFDFTIAQPEGDKNE